MTQQIREAFAALRDLGTPDELRAAADRNGANVDRPRTNAHVHLPPNFSAFENVKHVIDLADEQGIKVLGASNYYDYRIYGELAELGRERGIYPLFGLEIICMLDELRDEGVKINDPGNPGRMYLCGKGLIKFDEMTDEAQRLLGTNRNNDTARMAKMVELVEGIFSAKGVATGLNDDAVIDRVVQRHGCRRDMVCLQERHVCQAFQELFFEKVGEAGRLGKLTEVLGTESKAKSPEDHVAIQGDIRSHLMKAGKPAFVEEKFLNFDEAFRLILELGGIPCYPTLADGTNPICPFETPVEDLIGRLKERNIWSAELIPIRNEPEVLVEYVKAIRGAGLFITGGTEHNTLDLIGVEPTCLRCEPVPDEIKEIFWEGACVVAAHQFLRLNGQPGFVDKNGTPNPDFADAESRIQAFAALGKEVFSRYQQKYGQS